jgi:hypothetical protein
VIGGASALTVSVLVALPAAASTHVPAIQKFRPGHMHLLYDVGTHSTVTRAQALSNASLASTTFTQFKSTVTVGTKSYTYVLAGKNPAVKQTSPASTIKTELVPVIMKFSNGDTWDPTKIDSCDSGASALSRVQKSPIFTSQSWTWGGTAIGTGQVTDAFQRAEFWKYTKPTGINPGYAVNLSVTTLSPITINVPNADAAVASISCGNKLLGAANINWLDPYIQKTVLPSLASKGVNPGTLPIFLLHNFVEYIGTTSNCCVLGYHNAHSETGGVQTYGLSWYNNSGLATNAKDVAALSHEVGEWQNDPYTNNPTPAWGHIGQVTGCQSNLEVGDPLSGTTYTHTENGFTYHVQELAFFSWFYHQSPSQGVNGWYSDQGKFKSYAANCT